jgi:hypothetical protein
MAPSAGGDLADQGYGSALFKLVVRALLPGGSGRELQSGVAVSAELDSGKTPAFGVFAPGLTDADGTQQLSPSPRLVLPPS